MKLQDRTVGVLQDGAATSSGSDPRAVHRGRWLLLMQRSEVIVFLDDVLQTLVVLLLLLLLLLLPVQKKQLQKVMTSSTNWFQEAKFPSNQVKLTQNTAS